jgi:hypothetical protein
MIRTFPSLEVVESFTLPEHSTNAPLGIWPSTNRIALLGYVVRWLAMLKGSSTPDDSEQNQLFFRSLQETQFSLISKPYGVFIVSAFERSLPPLSFAYSVAI